MEDRVVAVLDELGERYELVPCDPELADTEAFCEAYGYELADSANTILVVGKSDPRVYAACVVLADTRLDVNSAARKRLGTGKASFASADETVEITGMTIGGVTPVGLPPELPLWVDSRVMSREKIILGGGSRDRKILCGPALLERLPNSEIVEGLAKQSDPVS